MFVREKTIKMKSLIMVSNWRSTIGIALCVAVTFNTVSGISFGNLDIAKSLVDVTTGIAKKIPDSIPSPDAIFSASKNLIAGYPFEVASKAVNLFC